jgi:hypothetical protein
VELTERVPSHTDGSSFARNVALQPRRPIIAPAVVGCKPLLDGILEIRYFLLRDQDERMENSSSFTTSKGASDYLLCRPAYLPR